MKVNELDIIFAWFFFDEAQFSEKKIPNVNGKNRPCLVLESLMGGYRVAAITSRHVSITGRIKKEAPFNESEAKKIGLKKAGCVLMNKRDIICEADIKFVVGNISNAEDLLLRRLHQAAKEAELI